MKKTILDRNFHSELEILNFSILHLEIEFFQSLGPLGSLAIAIVRFWCAKLWCLVTLKSHLSHLGRSDQQPLTLKQPGLLDQQLLKTLHKNASTRKRGGVQEIQRFPAVFCHQRKTKGQQLKGKIVSALFHTFWHFSTLFQSFS